jgi:hypothetical protein
VGGGGGLPSPVRLLAPALGQCVGVRLLFYSYSILMIKNIDKKKLILKTSVKCSLA